MPAESRVKSKLSPFRFAYVGADAIVSTARLSRGGNPDFSPSRMSHLLRHQDGGTSGYACLRTFLSMRDNSSIEYGLLSSSNPCVPVCASTSL